MSMYVYRRSHTQPHGATQSHTQPHKATRRHTQLQTATHSHTQTHAATHTAARSHTKPHTTQPHKPQTSLPPPLSPPRPLALIQPPSSVRDAARSTRKDRYIIEYVYICMDHIHSYTAYPKHLHGYTDRHQPCRPSRFYSKANPSPFLSKPLLSSPIYTLPILAARQNTVQSNPSKPSNQHL